MKIGTMLLFGLMILTMLIQTASAANIPDFAFDSIFDEYFSGNLTTFKLIEMAADLYMTKVGSLVFWSVAIASVYLSMYAATGGSYIPSAVFSAVGFVLIMVLPSELTSAMKVALVIGLFVAPVYQYVMR